MHADFELERASGGPADGLRCVVGKEDMGNEAEPQADDAGAEDERV